MICSQSALPQSATSTTKGTLTRWSDVPARARSPTATVHSPGSSLRVVPYQAPAALSQTRSAVCAHPTGLAHALALKYDPEWFTPAKPARTVTDTRRQS